MQESNLALLRKKIISCLAKIKQCTRLHITFSMTKKSVKARINGQLWTIKFGHPGKTDGVTDDGCCDYEKRLITINPNSQSNLLNVLSHELIHARLSDLQEDTVEELGTLIDEVYWQVLKLSFDKNHQPK